MAKDLALTRPLPRPARRTDWAPWLLALPALALFLGFFALPLANMLVTSSYRYDRVLGVIAESSFANYAKFLTDLFYLGILGRTLKVALLVTVVTLVLGYPVAYYLAHSSGRQRIYATLIVIAPLLVSVVVRTFGWLVILGPNGLVNALALGSGLVDSPIQIMFTETAIVIGLTHVFLPFMVLAVASSLQSIDPALSLAAANLGADRLRTFVRVTLPLSLPGVLAGSLLVFTLSTSAFITPALLGGARVRVMSSLVYEETLLLNNWPFGGAIAVVLLVITGISVLLYTRALEGGRFGVVFR